MAPAAQLTRTLHSPCLGVEGGHHLPGAQSPGCVNTGAAPSPGPSLSLETPTPTACSPTGRQLRTNATRRPTASWSPARDHTPAQALACRVTRGNCVLAGHRTVHLAPGNSRSLADPQVPGVSPFTAEPAQGWPDLHGLGPLKPPSRAHEGSCPCLRCLSGSALWLMSLDLPTFSVTSRGHSPLCSPPPWDHHVPAGLSAGPAAWNGEVSAASVTGGASAPAQAAQQTGPTAAHGLGSRQTLRPARGGGVRP